MGQFQEEEIVKAYRDGASLTQVGERFSISPAHASRIINKNGRTRSIHESLSNNGWTRLNRTRPPYPSRVVSLPKEVLKEAGINPDFELEGKWLVDDGHLVLRIRKTTQEFWFPSLKALLSVFRFRKASF